MNNKCIVCTANLRHDIYTAEGNMFCSKECLVEHYNGDEETAMAVAEEIDAEDVGIEPVCDWCDDECDASDLIHTDMGYLCDHCIAGIRSRGIEVIEFE